MRLGAFFYATGHHVAGWRHPSSGADGFNIMPATLPGGLDDVIELVLPELRRRGLVRTEYEGRTLRGHLGTRPPPGFPRP